VFILALLLVHLFLILMFLLLYIKFSFMKYLIKVSFIIILFYSIPYRISTGFFPFPVFKSFYNLIFYKNDILIKTTIDLSKKNNYFLPKFKNVGNYCVAIVLKKNEIIPEKEYDVWNNFTFIFKQNGKICKKVVRKLRKRNFYFEDGYPLASCRFNYPLDGKYYKNLELEILPLKDVSFLQGYETELVVDFPYPK